MKDKAEYPIVIRNLDWSFGENKILDNICLTIHENRFYGIIGPNGSGKTTLLKNMAKSLIPLKDSVFINDTDITNIKVRELARRISCVQQNTSIDFDFSVMDIVLMGRSPYFRRFQVESDEDMNIARMAMTATNTWHLKDKSINEISGGECQRVIIARALAQETKIMLLDEPISQLDIHHQVEILDTVKGLTGSRGITVVTVLHDLNLAAQYCDHLILLSEGRIVTQGTPEQVVTEENIQKVYNLKAHIMKNPFTGKPHIIPVKLGA